jgi:uncharacterized protein YciI
LATDLLRAAQFLLMLQVVFSGAVQAADTTQHSHQFYVITFEKGAAWVEDRRYEHQPDIDAHLEYWKGLYYQEILLMSGPWQDQSGGIFVVRASDKSTVDAIVERDPAVIGGIIKANIHQWRVLNSAMRSAKPIQIEIGPDESFRLERLDPDSPINLRSNKKSH